MASEFLQVLRANDIEKATSMLEAGNVDAVTLQHAMRDKEWSAAILELLLSHGAHAEDAYYMMIYYALTDADALRVLLEHGADPNAFGGNVLREAALGTKMASVKLLIEHGADPSLRDSVAITMAAERRENNSIVLYLLSQPKTDPSANRNLLLYTLAYRGDGAMVQAILADPRTNPSEGLNLILTNLIAYGNEALVSTILAHPRLNIQAAVRDALLHGTTRTIQVLLVCLEREKKYLTPSEAAALTDLVPPTGIIQVLWRPYVSWSILRAAWVGAVVAMNRVEAAPEPHRRVRARGAGHG